MSSIRVRTEGFIQRDGAQAALAAAAATLGFAEFPLLTVGALQLALTQPVEGMHTVPFARTTRSLLEDPTSSETLDCKREDLPGGHIAVTVGREDGLSVFALVRTDGPGVFDLLALGLRDVELMRTRLFGNPFDVERVVGLSGVTPHRHLDRGTSMVFPGTGVLRVLPVGALAEVQVTWLVPDSRRLLTRIETMTEDEALVVMGLLQAAGQEDRMADALRALLTTDVFEIPGEALARFAVPTNLRPTEGAGERPATSAVDLWARVSEAHPDRHAATYAARMPEPNVLGALDLDSAMRRARERVSAVATRIGALLDRYLVPTHKAYLHLPFGAAVAMVRVDGEGALGHVVVAHDGDIEVRDVVWPDDRLDTFVLAAALRHALGDAECPDLDGFLYGIVTIPKGVFARAELREIVLRFADDAPPSDEALVLLRRLL